MGAGVSAAAQITRANASRRDEDPERGVRQRLAEDDRAGGDRDDVRGDAGDRDHRHGLADLQAARRDDQADERGEQR